MFALLLPPTAAQAHNGRLGLAYPLDDIVIDGDFSDWPDSLHSRAIRLSQSGDPPVDSRDLQASFRVGYSEKQNSIFVAVEVADESIFLDSLNSDWQSQDGCEVYVDIGHGLSGLPRQYRLYGDHPPAEDLDNFIIGGLHAEPANMAAAVQRGEGFHRYEWRIGVEQLTLASLESGQSIGFDVAVIDRDEDGSFSWVSWGPQIGKVQDPDRVGDMLLLAAGTSPAQALDMASMVARRSAEISVSRARTDTGYQMFITGALLAFSLLHMLLFLFHPIARENLYYAIYTAGIAAAIFVGFQAGMSLSGGEGPTSIEPLEVFNRGLLIVASVLLGARIVFKICHVERSRHFRWVSNLLALGWVVTAIWLVYDTVQTRGGESNIPSDFFAYFTYFHLAIVVLALAEMLRVTMNLRRRAEATWIVGVGFAGFAAVVARLLYRGQIDYSVFLGVGSLLVSMSIYLAHKVARTSKDLEVQLQQVRDLSEKTLEQNRQIQEVNRLKSDFLARMSHDLRTPMNAIIGYTRILLRRLTGSVDERQYQNLENIDSSAHHLLHLINDILDLSKIEAGKIEVHPEDVDLRQLIGECLTSVSPLVKPEVQVQQDLDDDGTVFTDSDRLRRVLMNLISNADKFTEQGSITVSLRRDDDWRELAIADTGRGISPEDLPHIFDEFRQASDRSPTTQQGTGLGLSIVRKSVELLGGTVSVESIVGSGSTFTLRFGDYRE